MPYVGGKSQAGVYQRIINLIPPHRVYIEPFLGSGAIMRLKKPAEVNIGIEKGLLSEYIWGLLVLFERKLPKDCSFSRIHGCGIEFLESYRFSGQEFVYCEPPYLMETRRSRRRYYPCEMTEADHVRLLGAIKKKSILGL